MSKTFIFRCAFLGSARELRNIALGATAIGFMFGLWICQSSRAELAEGIAFASDAWLSLFEGCEPYVPGSGRWFVLPVSWLLAQSTCFLAVASHNGGRKSGLPLQAEIRGITQSRWWHSQFIWVAAAVTLVYAGLLLGATAGAAAGNGLVWGETTHGLMNPQCGYAPLATFFSMALLSSIGIACLQNAMLTTVTPVWSLIAALAYSAFAFVLSSPIALGSLSMSCRYFSNPYDPQYIILSYIACIMVFIASALIAGSIAMRRDSV